MSKKKSPHHFQVHDKYFIQAKKFWYRARSAFKLIEIQEKFNIIKPWFNILDVWSAPGSFLQVIQKIIKNNWFMIGIDIQKIEKFTFSNILLIQENIFNLDKIEEILKNHNIFKFDLITSDIAPSTTWQTGVDQYRSIELNLSILQLSKTFLKKWWNLLLKVFVWEDINDLIRPIKANFQTLKRFKPKASRDRSFEEYFICFNMFK